MHRTQSDQDIYELDYGCSYRELTSPEICRELSGIEKRNRSSRYSRRAARQSAASKGIHRRGSRRIAA